MQKLRWTLTASVVAMLICVGLILAAIYPYHPADIVGWIVLIVISVPIVLGLELIGTALLNNRIVTGSSRLARIVFGVVAVMLIAIPIVLAWKWVLPHLVMW
jgi:hypothetical protein